MLNQELNRRHAYGFRASVAAWVLQDLEVNIRHLKRRIARMEELGVSLIESTPDLHHSYQRLISIKGVAATSAMRILAELLTMPPDLHPDDRRQASFRFSDNCFSRSVDGLCTPEMTYRHH